MVESIDFLSLIVNILSGFFTTKNRFIKTIRAAFDMATRMKIDKNE